MAHKGLLKKIIAGNSGTPGYTLVAQDVAENLKAEGLVETNPSIVIDGKIATRATEKATQHLASLPDKPKVEIVGTIDNDIPMPEVARRGGVKEEQYPFSKLEVGQSFVVTASAEAFASTASSATRRFAEPTGETKKDRKGNDVPVMKPTRKFVVRPITAGQKYGNGFEETVTGSRVFRVA